MDKRQKRIDKVDLFKVIRESTKELSEKRKRIIKEEENLRMNVAIAMVKLRKELGISQKEMAQKLGVTQSWVSRLENANYDHRIESIWKYLKGLGAQIELRITYKRARKFRILIISDSDVHQDSTDIYRADFKVDSKTTGRSNPFRGFIGAS